MNCCEDMEKARQCGTDNEGFGPLVTGLRIGMELPEIRFCPWCGICTFPKPETADPVATD